MKRLYERGEYLFHDGSHEVLGPSGQSLPMREAGIDVVVPVDFGFTVFPAEQDDLVIQPVGEVKESDFQVLHQHAHLLELTHDPGEILDELDE